MQRKHAATVEPLTLEEFGRLFEEDEFLLELVRGSVVREPRPGARHSAVAGRLYYALETFVRRTDGGRVVFEGGFVLEHDPPTVRGPDVAFIAAERLPAGDAPTGWWEMAPDLVVEVLSPSNRPPAILEKVAQYLETGVRLVWVVDPHHETVTTYRPDGEVDVLRMEDTLAGGEVLPGFRLGVDAIFTS